MFGRFASLWALVTAVVAAIAGAIGYNIGLSTNLAAHGDVVAPPYPYYAGGWGFGFGWIIPLLVFILLFRLLFFRRHWYGGHRGSYGGWEQRIQDWHRQAHGEPGPPAAGQA